MMTLDECIAAARLPAVISYEPHHDYHWGMRVPGIMAIFQYKWSTRESYIRWRDERLALAAKRTRLSEQQGEKR